MLRCLVSVFFWSRYLSLLFRKYFSRQYVSHLVGLISATYIFIGDWLLLMMLSLKVAGGIQEKKKEVYRNRCPRWRWLVVAKDSRDLKLEFPGWNVEEWSMAKCWVQLQRNYVLQCGDERRWNRNVFWRRTVNKCLTEGWSLRLKTRLDWGLL